MVYKIKVIWQLSSSLKLRGRICRIGRFGWRELGQTSQRVFALPGALGAQQAEAGEEILFQPLLAVCRLDSFAVIRVAACEGRHAFTRRPLLHLR